MKKIETQIAAFIKKTVKDAGASGVVIGLSGGLDSSVTAALCVRALGPKRVFGIIMPEPRVTKRDDVYDAEFIAQLLGISYSIKPIGTILSSISAQFESINKNRIAYGNLKARIRMLMLYAYANQNKYLVAGTGNKSELLTGYFTKYGDGAADFLPIGDLTKTEVIQLAEYLNLPDTIIQKKPSAGLWHGQTDEAEMGMSYKELDAALSGKKVSKETAAKVNALTKRTEHKRNLPEICTLKHKS